jgi:hypothetical protein
MIATEYQDVTIRLPWDVTCTLAVKAFVGGMSMDRLMEYAMQKRLGELSVGRKINSMG